MANSNFNGKSPAQVQAELSVITYSGAIKHYQQQKQRFLNEMSEKAQITYDEALDFFEENIVNEINENPIYKQEEHINRLVERFGRAMLNKITEEYGSVQDYRKEVYDEYSKAILNSKKNLTKAAEELMSEDDLYRFIVDGIRKNYSTVSSGYSIDDLRNNIRGYRQVVLQSILKTGKLPGKKKIKDYTRPGQGYLREALIHKVEDKAYGKLFKIKGIKSKDITMATGSSKVNSVDTAFDEYTSFFDNVQEVFNSDMEAEEIVDIKGYGTQIKPWIEPWLKDSNGDLAYLKRYNNFQLLGYSPFTVGHRAKLLNGLTQQEKFSYTESTIYLSKTENTLDAIGIQNIMFITGASFYWTYQLIQNFRNINYFISFVFNKDHEATAELRWDTPWRVVDAKARIALSKINK